MSSWAIAPATLLGLLLAAGVAHGDGLDDQFLAMLSSGGVNGDPGRLVATGRQVCDWQNLPHDENPWSQYGSMRSAITTDLAAQGLSMPQIGQFMRDAIVVYCPDKKTWR